MGLPHAVADDAEQDDDHAHDHDDVRRELSRGELVAVPCARGREVRDEVGDPAAEEQSQAQSGQDGQRPQL